MSRIIYQPHLKRRLKERKIPSDYPKTIYKISKSYYFDNETEHLVAVSKLQYAEKLRNMVAIYDKIDENIEIVTVFPISAKELKNKIKSGRWQKQ